MLARRITNCMPSKPGQEIFYGLHQPEIVFSLLRLSPTTWCMLVPMMVSYTPSTPPAEHSCGPRQRRVVSFRRLPLLMVCYISVQMTSIFMPSTPQDVVRPPVHLSGCCPQAILSVLPQPWLMVLSMSAQKTTISTRFTWLALLHN